MAFKSYSQNLKKNCRRVVFEKKFTLLYFTSPMKISESKCNSKTPQKIHLILIQSKIPFELTKSLALRYYFQIFTKSYRVVFEKCSLHFTSAMKISKFKCNRKARKYPFSLIQRKFPFDCMCSMAFKSYSHN